MDINEDDYVTMHEASKKLDGAIFKHAEKLKKNLREKRKVDISTKTLNHV